MEQVLLGGNNLAAKSSIGANAKARGKLCQLFYSDWIFYNVLYKNKDDQND